MGVRLFGSSCSCDPGSNTVPQKQSLPNPNPKNWEFLDHCQKGNYLALRLRYPDCTNFEGEKILVFEAKLKEVISFKEIDPHFCEKGHLSPVARFQPTEEGWRDACSYCNRKNKNKPLFGVKK